MPLLVIDMHEKKNTSNTEKISYDLYLPTFIVNMKTVKVVTKLNRQRAQEL